MFKRFYYSLQILFCKIIIVLALFSMFANILTGLMINCSLFINQLFLAHFSLHTHPLLDSHFFSVDFLIFIVKLFKK